MKRMKLGIVTLVIAVLAITAAAVAAQTPSATQTPAPGQNQVQPPAQGQGQGQRPGRGQGRGMGVELQIIATALGEDEATLRTDLQSGKTIADIAKEKNVELSTIVDAVVAERQTTLATAVTDGRLTQEQADAQIVLLKANLNTLFTQKMDQQPGNRPGFGQRGSAVLDVIAKALGVDAATLQTDLQSGKTIADIAKEKNVELSTVVDAVVADRQTNIAAAVTDGRLTQEQADAQIALLKADLNASFTQKMDANGRGGFGGPMGGMGGFDGPMGGMGGFGGPGGRQHGNGGPDNNAPLAPDATPEATAAANA